MYRVFSKALLKCYAEMHGITPSEEDYNNIKPSKLLQEKVNVRDFVFLWNSNLTADETDKLRGPLSQYEMNKISKWLYDNVLIKLPTIDTLEINVKVRIVTSMMEKFMNNNPNKLPKYIFIIFCNNLVSNIRDLHYDITVEDLPFLGGFFRELMRSLRNLPQFPIMDQHPLFKMLVFMKSNNLPKITKKEVAIIKKAQLGDIKSFNKLFKKYKGFVENTLNLYIKDMDEAKDITNIVFLKVYNKLSTFTEYESFGGWLRIIANRTAIDYLRERKNKETYVDNESVLLPLSKATKHVEYEVADHMTYEQILSEFKKFPDNVCKELEMYYVDGLTTEQISKKLCVPEGTVKSHLSRARNKLKTILN